MALDFAPHFPQPFQPVPQAPAPGGFWNTLSSVLQKSAEQAPELAIERQRLGLETQKQQADLIRQGFRSPTDAAQAMPAVPTPQPARTLTRPDFGAPTPMASTGYDEPPLPTSMPTPTYRDATPGGGGTGAGGSVRPGLHLTLQTNDGLNIDTTRSRDAASMGSFLTDVDQSNAVAASRPGVHLPGQQPLVYSPESVARDANLQSVLERQARLSDLRGMLGRGEISEDQYASLEAENLGLTLKPTFEQNMALERARTAGQSDVASIRAGATTAAAKERAKGTVKAAVVRTQTSGSTSDDKEAQRRQQEGDRWEDARTRDLTKPNKYGVSLMSNDKAREQAHRERLARDSTLYGGKGLPRTNTARSNESPSAN